MDELITLLFPSGPPSPIRGGPPGLPLPSDFRELLARLGGGFVVDNRFYADARENLLSISEMTQKDLMTVHQSNRIIMREDHCLSTEEADEGDDVFHIPNLLLWGADDNGNQLFWEASGDPDTWTVVVRGDFANWARHQMSSIDYLYGLLSGSLDCPVFTLSSWPRPDMTVTLSAYS